MSSFLWWSDDELKAKWQSLSENDKGLVKHYLKEIRKFNRSVSEIKLAIKFYNETFAGKDKADITRGDGSLCVTSMRSVLHFFEIIINANREKIN